MIHSQMRLYVTLKIVLGKFNSQRILTTQFVTYLVWRTIFKENCLCREWTEKYGGKRLKNAILKRCGFK